MTSGAAALFGASVGALSGVLAVMLGNWYQSRTEHRRWIRDRKSEAYVASLRNLYRLSNRRFHHLTTAGQDRPAEWFDDYVAVIESLGALSIYARDEFSTSISEPARELRHGFEALIAGESSDDSPLLDVKRFLTLSEALEDAIARSAIRDLGLPAGGQAGLSS